MQGFKLSTNGPRAGVSLHIPVAATQPSKQEVRISELQARAKEAAAALGRREYCMSVAGVGGRDPGPCLYHRLPIACPLPVPLAAVPSLISDS